MIKFDDEIKQFKPSLEVDSVEEAIINNDLTDMNDIVLELMKRLKE